MLKVCSKKELICNEQQYDAIFCFGAGKMSKLIGQEFSNTVILKRIVCFVDNDILKEGTTIHICGNDYKVKGPHIFKEYNGRKVAVIITCKRLKEILKQLENDENLCTADFYYISFFGIVDRDIEAMKKKIPENLCLSKKPIIPKIIHYCWFGHNPMPDKNKIWMESWRKFCPDYKIIEWNESNYDVTKNSYMYQAYEQKKWGFVPDYARLDIIYRYGGIYLDTDVEIVASFDELLYQQGFAGFESEQMVALGLGFGAVPGLPIIKEMLDYYEGKNFVNEDGSLNLLPSPTLQTNILLGHGLKQNGEYQIINGLTIFPEKMFCGKSMFSRIIMKSPYTRSIHHYEASWQDSAEKQWKYERDSITEDPDLQIGYDLNLER